ncbi:MAG: iron chelate uptake ABC transporter family permease subunit [Micropruina sp.]
MRNDLDTDLVLVRRQRRVEPRRAVLVGGLTLVALVIAFGWSLGYGGYPLSFEEILQALIGQGSARTRYIVVEVRLPRALVGVLVGLAFGMSGALFQALARNPLASPDIIGITSGASTAAVAGIVLAGAGGLAVTGYALVGALATAALIFLLAYRRGTSPYRLVLVGIGISAFLGAITGYLLVRASVNELQQATVWMTGSLTGREWQHVPAVACGVAVLVPAGLLLARPLRIVQLGDDSATMLGLRPEVTRLLIVLVGVGLAALATAAAGPIAFVAFVSPAIARRLVRSPMTLLPSALLGGLLVSAADLIGRAGAVGVPLPVGVVTGVIGAPYLIWLLARANRIGVAG